MDLGIPVDDLVRLLSLRDANTRTVLLGTTLLGLVSGVIGVFALLRKRALMGDALSHAALPGLCIAFMVIGYKSFLGLLAGALVSGIVGILLILFVVRWTRINEDAAIGIVLSGFFGLGICLSRIVQNHPNGMQAGLETFIYGKAASMLQQDAWTILVVSAIVLVVARLLFKELTLLCFDTEFARSTGWPVTFLDLVLMGCVVAVTIVGLQSVGVVLIISLLITPSAAARFWTENLKTLVLLSAAIGATSAAVGTALSALYAQLPTGPLIVLVAALLFFFSASLAPKRGLLARYLSFRSLQKKIRRQNFLRAVFELLEHRAPEKTPLRPERLSEPFLLGELLAESFLPGPEVRREAYAAESDGLLSLDGDRATLREEGARRAIEVVRNHRLWELYLINFADIAPSHVDTSADRIEHVLPEGTVRLLEDELRETHPELEAVVPRSPHAIERGAHE